MLEIFTQGLLGSAGGAPPVAEEEAVNSEGAEEVLERASLSEVEDDEHVPLTYEQDEEPADGEAETKSSDEDGDDADALNLSSPQDRAESDGIDV